MALPNILKLPFNKRYLCNHHVLLFLLVPVVSFFTGCQTTEQAATQIDKSESPPAKTAPFIPEWVDIDKNLKSDSSSFSVSVMASNVDSVKAIQMAKVQALALLGHKLSELSEEQRVEIAENSSAAGDAEFIFHLRRAEEAIASGAQVTKLKVKKDESQFVGFAEIEIGKTSVKSNLKSYFSAQSSKYSSLIDSFDFTQIK